MSSEFIPPAFWRPSPGQQFTYGDDHYMYYPTEDHSCSTLSSTVVALDGSHVLVYIRHVECRCSNIHLVLMAGRVFYLRASFDAFMKSRIL